MSRNIKRLAITAIILMWVGIVSMVAAGQTSSKTIRSSKTRTALVLSRIEGGLGDINWAANIGKELEKVAGIKPTYLFVGRTTDGAIENLNQRSDMGSAPKIIYDLDKVEPGYAGVYVYRNMDKPTYSSLELKEIAALGEKFNCTVLFHMCWEYLTMVEKFTHPVEKRFILVEEYGDLLGKDIREENRIFFLDYKEKYGLAVSEADCMRLDVSADEFYNRLGEEAKKKFNLEYVKQLEKKIGVGVPYNFVYYNLFTKKNTFDGLLIMLSRFLTRTAKLQGLNNQDPNTPITFLVNQLDLYKEAKLKEESIWKHRLLSQKSQQSLKTEADEAARKDMLQKIIKDAGITLGEDGVQQINLASINRTFRLVSYENLSPEAFEYFLLKSELVAGCTGDMSLTQVLSSKRVPVYECLSHKRSFYTNVLNTPWVEAMEEVDIPVEKDSQAFPGLEEDSTVLSFSGMEVLTPENVRQIYPTFHSKLLQNAFSPWFKKRVEEILKRRKPKQCWPM
ncbi:hypothetical protein NEHOM01_1651 [Nematocida homosporus]|uniref:uncharacterized protein n=1 Tax=Nematocida homosporus TaxID=1912981 RepID=UPI0022211C6F|nr:uncharacterized protein NEHOM01_1651 [Nematocida homosporus]KAI5186712.1 hypothetical protein NEHOM01_1651 [Nematocida homosporus]